MYLNGLTSNLLYFIEIHIKRTELLIYLFVQPIYYSQLLVKKLFTIPLDEFILNSDKMTITGTF